MGMVKKSITVTDQQAEWIQSQIAQGDYASDSEYVRDLIRKEQQQQNTKLEALRAALIEGEESGMSKRTPDEIIRAVKDQLQKNGQL